MITSFSRTAAAELAGRDLPVGGDRIGTLHSHCYRALGAPEIAESNVGEWNKDNPDLAITPQKKHGRLEGEEAVQEDDSPLAKDGDSLLQQLSRFRGLMLPAEYWPKVLRDFGERWTEYKRENGLLDFTDLIEVALRDIAIAPGNPAVIFADEAQDLNRMQLSLIRKWGERAGYFIVAGDDDQASLPGSMVLIEGGNSVPVEELDPARHRLAAYDRVHSGIRGLRQGFGFRIEPSIYKGDAVRVEAAGRATRTTHNHPWLYRWTDASSDKHIVYLMRRGDSFRVGWCKLIRADGSCHLKVRAHLDGADAAWVLRLCGNRTEASLWESYVAAEYGINTAIWRPIDGHHRERAVRCLAAFGRDLEFPFIERGKGNRYGAAINRTAACNLLPDVMAIPVVAHVCSRGGIAWQPIHRIERFPYEGCVYGLSVPPLHTYIADGIVTHNCIYGFTGATPEAFLDPDIPEDHKILLKQSYRVPEAVHRLADRLIRQVTRRQQKAYVPRPEPGRVERLTRGTYKSPEYHILKTATEHLERGQSVMFLASCSYMLGPVVKMLRANAIPFWNPYRKSNGFWNPIRTAKRGSAANRVLSLLVAHPDFGRHHRPWTHADLLAWAECLVAKGLLRHGAKKRLASFDLTQHATPEALNEIFEPAALDSLMEAYEGDYRALLDWWRSRVNVEYFDRVKFPAEVAIRRGPLALLEPPRVVVGTIHSVKGGEADAIYVFPDMSQAGAAQYQRAGPPKDSVIRLFYVGVTRAREALYLCQRETAMAIDI